MQCPGQLGKRSHVQKRILPLTRGIAAESLRYSILAGTGLYLLAAALLLLAMRWLERDWAE